MATIIQQRRLELHTCSGPLTARLCRACKAEMETQKLSADEIIRAWRKGQISAHLRDGMLRAEGHELNKDDPSWDINECSRTCHLIAGHIGEHDES